MKHLAQALRRMHQEGNITRKQLEQWRDDALLKMAENSGQTIINASAHGISFSAAGNMRWDAWFAMLDTVLRSIDRNVKIPGSAKARFV